MIEVPAYRYLSCQQLLLPYSRPSCFCSLNSQTHLPLSSVCTLHVHCYTTLAPSPSNCFQYLCIIIILYRCNSHIPSEYLPKDSSLPPSGAIRQELTDQTVHSEGLLHQVASLPLQLPIKRKRELTSETEPSMQINKKLLTADNPMVEDDMLVHGRPSLISSNSIEIESDDNVIDLTQDT